MAKTRSSAKTARRRPVKGRPQGRTARRKSPIAGLVVVLALVLVGVIVLFLAQRERPGTAEATAPLVGGDLHSLAASPQGALWVGGHQAVAVSRDGGKTWRQVSSLENADAMGWAFLSEAIAVGGHPGLHISTDGGRSFASRNRGLPATDIHGLGGTGTRLFAASPQVGVFASTDAGRTWSVRTRSAGQAFMGRIVVDAANPERLLATDMSGGVVESTDGGRRWRSMGALQGAMWISQDPNAPQRLVAARMGEGAMSADGGQTWSNLKVPDGASIVEVGPGGTLFAAVHKGSNAIVWVSRDGGGTWSRP